MVQIPDWTAISQATPQPAYRRVQVDDSAAGVAGAVSSLGGAIMTAADAVQQKAKADAATWASNKLTDFRVQTNQAMLDAQANATDDAHGFTPGVLADFDKRSDALTGAAGANPLAAQFIEKAIPQLRAQVADSAMRWEAQQRDAFRGQSVLDNTNKMMPIVQAHPSQGPMIGGQLLAQIDAAGFEPDRRLALRNHVVSELNLARGRGNADADPSGTIAQLNDPNDQTYSALAPAQRDSLQQYARGQLVDQRSNSLAQVFQQQGAPAAYQAVSALDKDTTLTPDVVDAIRQKANGLFSQMRQDKRNQSLPDIAQLEGSIASGKAGPTETAKAWQLYGTGALDADQLLSTVTSIDRAQKRAADDAAVLADGMKNFVNSTPMDPKASDDKNAANAVFNALAAKPPPSATALVEKLGGTVPGAPGSDGYANAALAVTTHMGIVPPDVISWGRANLASGNPQSAAAAANLLSRLDETNPAAYGYAVDDPKTRAMVSTIANAVKAGTDPAAAVALARRNASLPQPELAALEEQWKSAKPQDSQASQLSSILGSDPSFKPGWFSGVPTPPPLMQGQFDALTRSYYNETGGNLTQARELAAQDLKRTWGVTQVNGQRELMQYAPEVMFPGLSADVVRSDVAKTVADNGALFQNVDPSQVHLTATDRTARTGGLDWALMVPDKFGAYGPVVGKDGNPLTYRLPVGNNDYAAVKAREAQASLESARQTQQLRKDAAEGQELAAEEQGAL